MMNEAIICDCDGTLSLRNSREIYDFNSSITDSPNEPIVELVNIYKRAKFEIIIISAREEKFRSVTEEWLKKNTIPFDHMFLRKDKDYRSDEIIKKDIYQKQIKDIWKVSFVLDDRNRVVKMWRDLGLACFQVNDGNF